MRKSKRISLFVFIMAILFLNTAFVDDLEWQLRKDRTGIQIYSRPVEGLAVKELKSVTTVKVSLPSVIAFFEDDTRVPEWMSNCVEYKEISGKDGQKYFYLRDELPPPFAARDTVMNRTRHEDPKTRTVIYALSGVPEMIPQAHNTVRMPHLKSLWRFIPAQGGITVIEVELQLDPGGRIPKWLANQAAIHIAFNSLKRFRRLVEKTVIESKKMEIASGSGG